MISARMIFRRVVNLDWLVIVAGRAHVSVKSRLSCVRRSIKQLRKIKFMLKFLRYF